MVVAGFAPLIPKAIVPTVSVSTTLVAVNNSVCTPPEVVTVTVFNAVAWPTLVRVIELVASKVRF